jgi:hypothetical protein
MDPLIGPRIKFRQPIEHLLHAIEIADEAPTRGIGSALVEPLFRTLALIVERFDPHVLIQKCPVGPLIRVSGLAPISAVVAPIPGRFAGGPSA